MYTGVVTIQAVQYSVVDTSNFSETFEANNERLVYRQAGKGITVVIKNHFFHQLDSVERNMSIIQLHNKIASAFDDAPLQQGPTVVIAIIFGRIVVVITGRR